MSIAHLAAVEYLSKSNIVAWTDLPNGSVQRHLNTMCDEQIIKRLNRPSPEYDYTRRQRFMKGLEGSLAGGGKPPTLYGKGIRWKAYEDQIDRISRHYGLGRKADDKFAEGRQRSGRAHRIEMTAKLVPDSYDRIRWGGDPRKWDIDHGEEVEHWKTHPKDATINKAMNGLRTFTHKFECEGIEWSVRWNISRNGLDRSSVSIISAKGASYHINLLDDIDDSLTWLWDRATGTIQTLALWYGVDLAVATSPDDFARSLEVGAESSPELNKKIKAVETLTGKKFSVKTSMGTVFIDNSGENGRAEIETNGANAFNLPLIEEKINNALTSNLENEGTQQMLVEELKALRANQEKMLQMLEVLTNV